MGETHTFADLRHSGGEEDFRRQETDSVERLRRRQAAERVRRELAEAVGVEDEGLLDRLRELGFTRETVALAPLVPLVRVAWAEGRVTADEREAVFEAAKSRGVTEGSQAQVKLKMWLKERPAEEFLERAARMLGDLLAALPPERRERESEFILRACTRVANASGGGTGSASRGGVCHEERAEIERIAAALWLKNGASFGQPDPAPRSAA
jgi:hypothetical protein